MELVFEADALAEHGLPDIGYPVSANFDHVMSMTGELPFPLMLHGLQQASAKGDADWKNYEPAMARLSELIAPDDRRAIASAAGPEWWIEIGPVDLAGPIVTVQRGDALIAAMAPRNDGRLRVAGYRPLDGNSAGLIIDLALRPHPELGTVCMRQDNWDYAKDCSVGMGQTYAFYRDQSHLSWWGEGLGHQEDGRVLDVWAAMVGLQPRPAVQVVMELGVAYAYS